MSRKATCYYFGVVGGLIIHNVAQVREDTESTLTKLAERHINRLPSDWEEVIKSELTPEEMRVVTIGRDRGIKTREALA